MQRGFYEYAFVTHSLQFPFNGKFLFEFDNQKSLPNHIQVCNPDSYRDAKLKETEAQLCIYQGYTELNLLNISNNGIFVYCVTNANFKRTRCKRVRVRADGGLF